jgi:hypothetical protein
MQSPLLSPIQSPERVPSPEGNSYLLPPPSERYPLESCLSNQSHSSSDSLDCSDETFTSYLSRCRRHPWHLLDYHTYLAHADTNRLIQQRRKECHLVELDGIRGVLLQNDMDLDNITPGTTPKILFMNLPIPVNSKLGYGKLFLGFDLATQNLLGYLFVTDSPIENYNDLWLNWKRGVGQHIINMPVDRLLEIVEDVMKSNIEVLEIGILHHYAATTKTLPAGVELVVVIQFLQFIEDCADMIWQDGNNMRETYGEYQEQLREIIAFGSSQAWFAGRELEPLEVFRQKHLRKLAGPALWYGQNVVDLRDQAESFGSGISQPHDQVSSEHVVWLKCSLLWCLIFIMLLLGLGFLLYLGSNLLEWPLEWENQQHGLLKLLPFKREIRTPGMLEWIPFIRKIQKISMFEWTPFKQKVQDTGFLACFPFMRQVQEKKVFVSWPFKQQTQSVGKRGWLSFYRQVQQASMSEWWPLKQVIQKVEEF